MVDGSKCLQHNLDPNESLSNTKILVLEDNITIEEFHCQIGKLKSDNASGSDDLCTGIMIALTMQ